MRSDIDGELMAEIDKKCVEICDIIIDCGNCEDDVCFEICDEVEDACLRICKEILSS